MPTCGARGTVGDEMVGRLAVVAGLGQWPLRTLLSRVVAITTAIEASGNNIIITRITHATRFQTNLYLDTY